MQTGNNTSIVKTLWPMLFSAKGRLNRKPFIGRIACVWIITGVLYCLNVLLNQALRDLTDVPPEYFRYIPPEMWLVILAALIIVLVILLLVVFVVWWEVVLYIRRLHDINLSGWWVLVTVPCYFTQLVNNLPLAIALWVLNLGTLLLLCVIKGTCGPNRFGENSLSDHTSCFV